MGIDCSEVENCVNTLRKTLKESESLETSITVMYERQVDGQLRVCISEKSTNKIKISVKAEVEMPVPIMDIKGFHFTAVTEDNK